MRKMPRQAVQLQLPAARLTKQEKKRMSFKEDFGKVPLCNHRADRGIYIHGFCLPLCSRCTGLLIGVAGGVVFRQIIKNVDGATGFSKGSGPLIKVIAGSLMAAPTGIDDAAEYFGGRESTNRQRFITGVIAGLGCATAEDGIISAVKGQS